MNTDFITLILIILIQKGNIIYVESEKNPIYNLRHSVRNKHFSTQSLLHLDNTNGRPCTSKNMYGECAYTDDKSPASNQNFKLPSNETNYHVHHRNRRRNPFVPDVKPLVQHLLIGKTSQVIKNSIIHTRNIMYPLQNPTYQSPNFVAGSNFNMILNSKPYNFAPLHTPSSNGFSPVFSSVSSLTHSLLNPSLAMYHPSFEKYARSLDDFERKFYMVTLTKLTSISSEDRKQNGMSFVQSGFFLHLTLMALSMEVDALTKSEIEKSIGFQASDMDIKNIIRELMSMLPDDSTKLKFRRVSRLVLWPGHYLSTQFRTRAAAALRLVIDKFNGTEKSDQMHHIMNQKIETDSGGAIRDTFDEEDLSGGVTAILMTTLYFRGRWRVSPTVLNGTWPFQDVDSSPNRTVRMIKLNDIMGYADIKEWNAQALEIPYATPGLSLVIILPREPSLRRLADYVSGTSITRVTARMRKMRVAATLPLYTLRMTLLLPNKLQAMGVSRLFDVSNQKPGDTLKLSHMVQRLMFWAEAGRNAYKDDGLEWEEKPDIQFIANKPYIFFVRWRNITLMNGNFVL